MKRRSFLKSTASLALAGAVSGLLPARAGAAEELRLLTWEGYADDSWVKDFEAANGVTVSKTYVGSNDEYMAKLAAGGGDYDLVVIVSSLAKRAIDAGFVEALDPALIPNMQQLFPRLQTLDFLSADGKLYGAPTFIAVSPVTVDADTIPEGEDFGILFDPQYSGRIAMWDDVSTIGDVANWMGYENIWTLDDVQLDAVKARLIGQKPLIRTYWSQAGEAIDLFKNKEIVATNSWSYITSTLKGDGFAARDFYSKPPLAALDSHFVVKGSAKRELAHKFIDHILNAKSQGNIADVTALDQHHVGSHRADHGPKHEPGVDHKRRAKRARHRRKGSYRNHLPHWQHGRRCCGRHFLLDWNGPVTEVLTLAIRLNSPPSADLNEDPPVDGSNPLTTLIVTNCRPGYRRTARQPCGDRNP